MPSSKLTADKIGMQFNKIRGSLACPPMPGEGHGEVQPLILCI